MTAGFLVMGVMLWAAVSKIAQNGKKVRRHIRSESMQH